MKLVVDGLKEEPIIGTNTLRNHSMSKPALKYMLLSILIVKFVKP